MGSQAPSHVRGCAENSVFDTSWFTGRKLALVPGSRLYYYKDVCYIDVCLDGNLNFRHPL